VIGVGDLASILPLATIVLAVLWRGLGWVMAVGYRFARARLQRLVPGQRSSVLLIVSAMPLGIGLAMTAAVFTPWVGGHLVAAHCHGELDCKAHVPTILSDPVAYASLGLATLFAGYVLLHLGRVLLREIRLWRNLGTLARQSPGDIVIIDHTEPIAFSLGLFRPTACISQALIKQTSYDELQAVIQHEQAHGDRRDNLRAILASICTLGFPAAMRRQLVGDLRMAAEQACDGRAASALADPLLVAQTLIKVQRLSHRAADLVPCGFSHSNTAARVLALLQPNGVQAGGRLVLSLLTGSVGLIILGADSVHHLVETVLGWLQDAAS